MAKKEPEKVDDAVVRKTGELLRNLVVKYTAPETLTAAASSGDLEAAQAFLDTGSSLEEKSVGYSSPLEATAMQGRTDAVDWLLAKGADPHIKTGATSSPMAAALNYGHRAIFRKILDASERAAGEQSAMNVCAYRGYLDELRELIARVGVKNGRYAIQAGSMKGQFTAVKMLMDAGAEWREFTALRIPEKAKEAGFIELHKFLMGEPFDEGAALAAETASRDAQESALKQQMIKGAERNPTPDPAERRAWIAELRACIQKGGLPGKTINDASIEVERQGGARTPLSVAALVGDASVVADMLAVAKPNAKTRASAKDLARGPEKPRILELLAAT